MTIKELKKYKPPLTRRNDFDGFWEETLKESAKQPLNVKIEKINYPIKRIKANKVFYNGFNGGRICAYFITEKNAKNNPTLLYFHGLPGNKGLISGYTGWALSGYNFCAVDVRGQLGESTDGAKYLSGAGLSVAVKGILKKEEYYYRNVFMDCVRALEFLCGRPEVDKNRIGVTGVSQGGGLAIATCALDPRPKLCMPDLPYLCNFERLIETAVPGAVSSFRDVIKANKGKEKVIYDNLSYFDCMNLADKIRARTLMCIGLKDVNCPPPTGFAAYNRMICKKEIAVYKDGKHDWPSYHIEKQLSWIVKYLYWQE